MARPRLVPLKPKSIVDSIRIERVASVAPSMLIYDGTDTENDERVVIREYFPAAIATRESGGSGVEPASEADKKSFEEGLTRFVEHGRALYPFRHKNVVALRAMVEANGTAYLISDHIDGAPLDDLIEPGDALVVDEIDEILPGLLDGLAALHHGQLLHRAIAPGAILIRRDGMPILDLPAPTPAADDIAPPSLAPYVSANWREPSVGPVDDIYALSATLFRLITGSEPKPGRERLAADASGSPDREAAALATLGREWPSNLRTCVALCLRSNPAERPASISQVRDVLATGVAPVGPSGGENSSPPAAGQPPEPPAAKEDRQPEPQVSASEASGETGPSASAPTDGIRRSGGKEPSDAKTRPATGVDRKAGGDLPRQPDDVSTVWLGSGGGGPTELPRRRTAKPKRAEKRSKEADGPTKARDVPDSDDERTGPTQPGSRSKTGRSGRHSDRDQEQTAPRSEPSFRRKTTQKPGPARVGDDEDGEPTVRVERSERMQPPRRDKDVTAAPGKGGPEPDEPPTVPVRRSEEETKPGKPKQPAKAEEAAQGEAAEVEAPEVDAIEEEPATVPFRRATPADEDDAPGPGEETGVIYRKGAATPVRAPSRPSLRQAEASASEESPSGAPVVPAGLSLIAPASLPANQWQDLVVFLHDPGLASVVAKHIHENPAPGTGAGPEDLDAQNLIVSPETPLTVTPLIEEGRANPTSITLRWEEIFHRLDFRIAPLPGARPESGVIRVFMGPILLAESPLVFSETPGDPQRIGVRGFRAPFFSYVAGDEDIVPPLAAAAAHLRSPVTARAMSRRETPWDRDVLPMIEQADVMFLYWSAEASRSPHVRKEWEFALELHGPEFIRLISWVDPMPAPPIELSSVPLIRLGKNQLSLPT